MLFKLILKIKFVGFWEPALFDKTDSRDLDNPEWKYLSAVMNHALIDYKGKLLPLGLDARNENGRALFDRDLLGSWVNKCEFPNSLVWLMKDTILPPIVKITDKYLGVAMGAALMTERNAAENVKAEDLGKLVFVPYANPFRVYELYKDVEAFKSVIENGADCYVFNSASYWVSSVDDLIKIDLQTSLTLQTAILTDSLEWEPWKLLPGSMIPTKASMKKLIPDYYEKFDPEKRKNIKDYHTMIRSRFRQRIDFLESSDIVNKPELLEKLIAALKVNC